MKILVDATTAIALGSVGEIELLSTFDGTIIVPPEVVSEVTTEPAATALDRFRSAAHTSEATLDTDYIGQAMGILDEPNRTGDVRLVADVLAATDRGRPIAIASDDRRVRTVTRGLGATVTGTIGVVVRAVENGMAPDDGKALVRRIDENGLHMTGELRDRADELIDAAGD